MTIPQHHPTQVDLTPGDSVDCPPDCEETDNCRVCGYSICPVHSEPGSLSECLPDGGYHHLDDCAYYCKPCADEAWDDRQVDKADAIRKGEWDD